MHPPTYLHGVRTPWRDAPADVQQWVLERCGPLTAPARDCVGGMATGVAAVLSGRRRAVFVKTVDAENQQVGAELYRQEAERAARLPRHPSVPALIEAGEVPLTAGGAWWVNLLEARPGRTPQHPWRAADLDLVLTAWAELAPVLHATPWPESASLSELCTTWGSIAADPTDPWHSRARTWVEREAAMAAQVDGGDDAVLSHIDLRADNLLIGNRPDEVSFLDWAHPGTAAVWADVALLLADVAASGGGIETGGEIDVAEVFARVHPAIEVDLGVSLISTIGAFLHRRALREPPSAVMPHRSRWSRAVSDGLLPFIEAHTR